MRSTRDPIQRCRQGTQAGRLLAITCLAAISASCAAQASRQAPPAAPQAQTPAAAPATTAANPAPTAEAKNDPPVAPANLTPQQQQMQQRKNQLAADTAQLLKLANELKAEMDKSTKDELSLSVIKKADQVEKLAHKVRDEMKLTMGN